MKEHTQKIIIVGPCALESEEHAKITIEQAKKAGIQTIRMNLYKPRTKPGFDGIGEKGIPFVREAAEQGLTPAMEVILPEHLDLLMEEVLGKVPHATLLVWIGSRNQNHLIHHALGKAIAREPRVKLMIKNQPWRDEAHWKGIVEHVMDGGASKEQLLLCHRGFAPWDKNVQGMRNIPDLEMAQRVREELEIPLIMDPSHIGGELGLVKQLATEFAQLPWVDGQILEVHPDPKHAQTDAKQQLTWEELNTLLPILQQKLACEIE